MYVPNTSLKQKKNFKWGNNPSRKIIIHFHECDEDHIWFKCISLNHCGMLTFLCYSTLGSSKKSMLQLYTFDFCFYQHVDFIVLLKVCEGCFTIYIFSIFQHRIVEPRYIDFLLIMILFQCY